VNNTQYLDQLVLGANPLVGVDHFSRARGRDRILGLGSDRILQVIESAFSSGATGFNFGPDSSIYGILRRMKENGYSKSFGVYFILPDMRTYSNAYLTKGAMGVMKELLNNLSWTEKAKAIVQGGLTMLTANPTRGMNMYIDIELSKLLDILPPNAALKSTLVFEAITDMILSFRVKSLLIDYVHHVEDTFHIKPGFVTRNFTRFVEFVAECDIPFHDIVIMTPFNRLGFQMTPSRESCEKTLASLRDANIIGMSLLAGGALSLSDAIQYLAELKNLKSVAVGVSSEGHARETFSKLANTLSC
jgi:hypothetical protein